MQTSSMVVIVMLPNIVLRFTTENFTDVDIHGEWAVSSQNIWINESPTVCVKLK